jgi:DNA polymerase I-like protein with 3'-5' exonuclease and polymerase domains
MLSLDVETTGVDLRHGVMPFFVTTCTDDGEQAFWEWDVDPLTRKPVIPEGEVVTVSEYLFGSLSPRPYVLQNPKFDFAALETLGLWDLYDIKQAWRETHDTLTMSHILASSQPHDLTSLAVHYLGQNILPIELRLKEAVRKGRSLVQQARLKVKRAVAKDTDAAVALMEEHPYATWRIADEDLPELPSAKGDLWKNDLWLPRAIAKHEGLPVPDEECQHNWKAEPGGYASHHCTKCLGHRWWLLTREYANKDSEVTVMLYHVMSRELKRRKLWKIYETKLHSQRLAYLMEKKGITLSCDRLEQQRKDYTQKSKECELTCIQIAESYIHTDKEGVRGPYQLILPKGSRNASLHDFCIKVMKLPPVYNPKAKTNSPTLDSKNAIPYYLETLRPQSKQYRFIKALADKRSRDTAVTFMNSYERFWKPLEEYPEDWYVLHPHLNPTGTSTLRWSSSAPNEQNISKRESFNLRYLFGPAPGREWWSLDARNIELRIPFYESGEEEFIALFERPDDPPYFGSNHLLISHLLHKEKFEKCVNDKGQVDGRIFKKVYASTLYQRVKNGNFAVQYGAVDRPDGLGTADRTYGIPGAQAIIASRFKKLEGLNQKWIQFADKHGYVETIPDKTVDPERGYPVMCSRTEYGKIKPTVPLNYHVQSSAMWWMLMAMIRCQDQLDEWNEMSRKQTGQDQYFMVMQVHDELVFDFPRSRCDPREDIDLKRPNGLKLFRKSNLWRIREIQRIMELGGVGIGIPTPVSCEYHPDNWSTGISV